MSTGMDTARITVMASMGMDTDMTITATVTQQSMTGLTRISLRAGSRGTRSGRPAAAGRDVVHLQRGTRRHVEIEADLTDRRQPQRTALHRQALAVVEPVEREPVPAGRELARVVRGRVEVARPRRDSMGEAEAIRSAALRGRRHVELVLALARPQREIRLPLEALFARLPAQPLFRTGWLTDLLHFGVSHLLVQVTVFLTLVPAAVLFR